MPLHKETGLEDLGHLYPGGARGLSEKEAAQRLKRDGYNEIPSAERRGALKTAVEVVKEPMLLLLLAGVAVYFLLGDLSESLMLLVFVFVVMGITFFQERKTERALEALREMSSPRALVIRDGKKRRIPGREVARGDLLILSEGDRVPADGRLVYSANLLVNESMLTGEALPVRKSQSEMSTVQAGPGGQDLPFVYSGTLVVQGSGIAIAEATGAATEIGRIGKSLKSIETRKTPLQRETGRLVTRLALLGIALGAVAAVLYGFTRRDWAEGVLAGIALAMATLPEEFTVVLTVFLALGAWRISRIRVLTRKVPAVENLGAATVLCVDKTGTITLNMMRPVKVRAGGVSYDIKDGALPEPTHEVVEFGILASDIAPYDPMENSLKELGRAALGKTEHLHFNWELVREYPLSRELLSISRVWRSPDSSQYIVAAKGAPEAIADLCHMEEASLSSLSEEVNSMAAEGLRVIGIARARFRQTGLPGVQHDFKFDFLGLIGFEDPVRPGVAKAVEECRGAGIRVVMITGDYPVTARNVAAQIGLEDSGSVITGPELSMMTDEELEGRIEKTNVFARVQPEQKLRIVEALKSKGEIVAMTGDGVNDTPALKAADIGIAMGARGSDVARESAGIVLLDDDFTSIVSAVAMGRRVFDNLKKAIAYIVAIHIPIAGLSLVPVALRWPLVLLPVHIVFLQLIIDPACSIVFEAEPAEPDIMKRPPRKAHMPLLTRPLVAFSVLQGLGVLVITLAVLVLTVIRGLGWAEARTLSFTTLIIANITMILANRTWSATIVRSLGTPNSALWWVLGGAALLLLSVLYVPYLRGLFSFTVLHPADLVICLLAGVASLLWFEGFKAVKGAGARYLR